MFCTLQVEKYHQQKEAKLATRDADIPVTAKSGNDRQSLSSLSLEIGSQRKNTFTKKRGKFIKFDKKKKSKSTVTIFHIIHETKEKLNLGFF